MLEDYTDMYAYLSTNTAVGYYKIRPNVKPQLKLVSDSSIRHTSHHGLDEIDCLIALPKPVHIVSQIDDQMTIHLSKSHIHPMSPYTTLSLLDCCFNS